MRSRNLIAGVGLLCAGALGLPSSANAGGGPGDAGLLFLRQGIGAREAAMGGTGVASTEGAAAAYWNPSRLAFAEAGTSFLVQQQSWLGSFDYTAASLAHHGTFGVVGLTFAGFFADKIDRYGNDMVGIPEGTFSPYDLAFGGSYSRAFSEEFALGAQVKLAYEKIDIYSGSLLLFDLFATWDLRHLPGVTLGVSATNLGGQMTINQEPFDPPKAVAVGGAWSPRSGSLADRLTVAGDLTFVNDGGEKGHLGAEVKVVPELALRAGYKLNYDNQGLTAGAGIRYNAFGLGYAYEDVGDDALDPGHRVSLEFYF
ncbi:MAG TPA: PorV/PorQ family protein [Candidatus Krumholzibacteria bacterium]|nr:PorV/PorQ family protein [Candidatus Krumholzibacteria bacterium]HPD71226.1 PorV/PorQ family protein [Candidatus Krumholzibacteria bacterium]HRY39074.1 PorV/PorQ family protein [Candidatus Krumholzibacteria bacterium]